MTTFAVTSVSSLLCHASTCFRMGSKLRCIRSTPTAMQSISENDFECFASTGVKSPGTMFPNSGSHDVGYSENSLRLARGERVRGHFPDGRPATNLICFQITRAATDIRIREDTISRVFFGHS